MPRSSSCWLGFWGIILDTVIAVIIVTALFLRSRRNAVTASNAMSEVAESGTAVKVKRNPPPTRRQRAIAREEARRRGRRGGRVAKTGRRRDQKGPQR